ncbi:hypothetical protein [Variovorax saccharolyticus]|uniref:hypothetical protein n=1 Tax=Variovorax saccharolyticus TaxID=3053516 RepID=UPI002577DC11|nr:hypothetical protein [Variovorax sp. J31P216]MDM0029104.1 hypothetical protein [Variovorax sp. J31P216]
MSTSIQFASKRAAKRATQNMEMFRGVKLYQQLENPVFLAAATIVELFRSGTFALNGGHLATLVLQQRLAQAMEAGQDLVFELGWGQAKRDAGRLKTPGSQADLAELIALGRLATIVSAARLIANRPVSLRIISGGARFYEALFVDPDRDQTYNCQRASFIELLGAGSAIYLDTINHYWTQEEIKVRLVQALGSDTLIVPTEEEVHFVLFNIDWYHILSNKIAPHGLLAPPELISIYEESDEWQRSLLLRYLFYRLARPEAAAQTVLRGLDARVLERSLAWMEMVARQSAQKYKLLGQLTPRAHRNAEESPCPVPVTVVEKKAQPDIPALCLLGHRAGAGLPQHVTPFINDKGVLEFWPYMLIERSCHPVRMPVLKSGSGEIIRTSTQPLLMSALERDPTIKALMRIDMFDGL